MKFFGFGFLTIWALFWTAIVGIFDAFLGYGAIMQLYATTYETTDGVIVESKAEGTGDDTSEYKVKYEFTVDGQKYVSEQHRYDSMGSDDGYAEEMARLFPPGSNVLVYYNPNSPEDAVLETGINGGTLFFAFFLTPFNVIAVGSWYILIQMVRKGTGEEIVHVEKRSDQFGDTEHLRIGQTSPLGAFAGSLIGISFVSIFIIGFGFGFHAPTSVMVCWWIGMIGLSTYAAYRVKRKAARGDYDLIINDFEKTVSLPATARRNRRVTVQVSDIVRIYMKSHVQKGSDSDHTEYRPIMLVNEDGEERHYILHSYNSDDTARAITEWLQERFDMDSTDND